jgi:heme/copper-type cytochrome/quinol oxidase subunit 3
LTATEDGHIDPHVFNSYYPFLLAIGGAVALTGIAVHPAVFVAGMMVVLYSVVQLAIHSKGLPKFKSRFEDMSPDEHILGGTSTFKMGIWMFLVSEILFFTGLIGTGIALRVRSDWWAEPGEILNVPLTAANTFFLICSSMTMVEALRAAELGDNRRMRIALLATMGIGILFVSVQAVEYLELIGHHFTPDHSNYASAFFVQTGFHGGHVSGGIVALAIINWKAWKGQYDDRKNTESIEMMGLYWHFVDVVWIFLFTIVYLI